MRQASDRGSVCVRLGPGPVPAVELGRANRAPDLRGKGAQWARRTQCSADYPPGRSGTNSRSSPASTPPSSASAQPRARRRFATPTDSPPKAPTGRPPRRERRADWSANRSRTARGARGQTRCRCEPRRSQAGARGKCEGRTATADNHDITRNGLKVLGFKGSSQHPPCREELRWELDVGSQIEPLDP